MSLDHIIHDRITCVVCHDTACSSADEEDFPEHVLKAFNSKPTGVSQRAHNKDFLNKLFSKEGQNYVVKLDHPHFKSVKELENREKVNSGQHWRYRMIVEHEMPGGSHVIATNYSHDYISGCLDIIVYSGVFSEHTVRSRCINNVVVM